LTITDQKEMDEPVCSDLRIKKNYDLFTSVVGIEAVNAVTTIVNTKNFTSFQSVRQYVLYQWLFLNKLHEEVTDKPKMI